MPASLTLSRSKVEELKVMIFLSCKKLKLVPLGDWKEEPGYSVTKTDMGSSFLSEQRSLLPFGKSEVT